MWVVQIELDQPFQMQLDLWIKHWHHRFDAAIKVSWHPIGTAEIELGFTIVGEPEEA
jgi:hypothetical protein